MNKLKSNMKVSTFRMSNKQCLNNEDVFDISMTM